MFNEIIDKVNTVIKAINESYNAKKALTSNEIVITFYNDTQCYYCLVFFNQKMNFTVKHSKIEAMLIENVITVLQKIHLLNSHLSFYVNEFDMNIFQLKSQTLLLPLMPELIKSFEAFFQQPIEEDQRIIEYCAINDKESIDLMVIYHSFLSIGAFDLMLFNNRLIDAKAMSEIICSSRFSQMMKKDYGLIVEGNQLTSAPRKNIPKNFSLIILVNYTGRDAPDSEMIVNKICDCLEAKAKDYSEKIMNYASKMNLKMNFHIIKQSLVDVYHLTQNPVLFEKMRKLLENDKEPFENKLFNSFIQGKYNRKEEKMEDTTVIDNSL